MAILIVPIGEMGSGKSTATQLLKDEALKRGLEVETMAFAAPLKFFARDVFRFSDHALWGPSEERNRVVTFSPDEWKQIKLRFRMNYEPWVKQVTPYLTDFEGTKAAAHLVQWFEGLQDKPLSPRIVLQTLGTDWGRDKVCDTIWIDYLRDRVRYRHPQHVVVVEDGRFLNEARESGGFPLLIRRYRQLPLFQQGLHQSEAQQGSAEMLEFCQRHGMVVDNTGSVDHLRQCMKGVLDTVKRGS